MVAKGLKDYAKENGLKVSEGVVYGVVGGYMVTLKEGYGIKEVSVSGAITDESAKRITEFLQSKDANKNYRVANFKVMREGIVLEIADTVGTMKKIKALLDFLPNFLRENGVLADGLCTACGNAIEATDASRVVLVNGMAHRVHEGCSAGLMERANVEQARHEVEDKKLGKGIMGAAAGALLGSIIWAVIYTIGFIAAVGGFAIGALAANGYDKMGGRPCKAKMPIVLVFTVLGVAFGQYVSYVAYAIMTGEFGIVDALLYQFFIIQDPEFASPYFGDLAMGVAFAILGAIGVLKKASKENKDAALRTTILE